MASITSRLWVLIGAALVLAAAGTWYLLAGGDGDAGGREAAIARIEKNRRRRDIAALAEQAANPDVAVARRAVEALGRVGPESLSEIKRAMEDPRPQVRQEAATAFGSAGRYDAAAPLAALAKTDESANVRAAAVSALGRIYAFDEVDTLLSFLDDPDVAVRRRAAAAFVRIVGEGAGFKANDPPAKRRGAVQRMREIWADPEIKGRVREYWPMMLGRREKRKKSR